MDELELFERCREYDADRDIEDTAEAQNFHIAGSYGMHLANLVFMKNMKNKIIFEEYNLRNKNPAFWDILHLVHNWENEVILREKHKIAV